MGNVNKVRIENIIRPHFGTAIFTEFFNDDETTNVILLDNQKYLKGKDFVVETPKECFSPVKQRSIVFFDKNIKNPSFLEFV